MKDKPILFSTPMVQAIMEGRKTQTRRIINNKVIQQWEDAGYSKNLWIESCPYQVGQNLWVRETWHEYGYRDAVENGKHKIDVVYKADDEGWEVKWKPSIFMPKNYARIWLEVTEVRIERLQDITLDDICEEGIILPSYELYAPCVPKEEFEKLKNPFVDLWDSLNKKRGYGWDTNPYVWVVEFKLLENGSNT